MRLRKSTNAASPPSDRPTMRQTLRAFLIEQSQNYRSLRSMAQGIGMTPRQLSNWFAELGLPRIFGQAARDYYRPLGPHDVTGGQGI